MAAIDWFFAFAVMVALIAIIVVVPYVLGLGAA